MYPSETIGNCLLLKNSITDFLFFFLRLEVGVFPEANQRRPSPEVHPHLLSPVKKLITLFSDSPANVKGRKRYNFQYFQI